MRRLALVVVLLSLGCASETKTIEKVVEVPPDTATSSETGGDSAIADTGGDTSSSDTSLADADTGSLEETRCKGGAPRLEWKTVPPFTEPRCYDTAFASDAGVAPSCAFLLAEDGPLRCLPRPFGKLVAAWKEDCVVGGKRLLGADLVPADRPGLTMASVQQPSGRYIVRPADLWGGSAWRYLVDGTDVCQPTDSTGPFPFAFAGDGVAVRVWGSPIPLTGFYAAP